MENLFLLWETPWDAWKATWVHPLWLVAILLVAWQYAWKGIREERRFGSRLDPPTTLFLYSLFLGFGVGIFFSMGISSWMVDIKPSSIFWVWGGILGLSLFRLRFACPAYAVGLLTLFSLLWEIQGREEDGVWSGLSGFHTPDWMLLISLLHFLEWALVRLDGHRGSTPTLETSLDGRRVGGALLQKVWALPLVIFTPGGWLPLPLVIGFARLNLSRPMQQQKRRSSSLILLYAGNLLILSVGAMIWPSLMWVAACFCFLGHEGLYQLGRYRERRRTPLYASGETGVKVLAVWPNSPAAMMGIYPGYSILRVNGEAVANREEMEEALARSAAFCRLEMIDEQGEVKLAQRALYQGDPVHLGVVEAPKDSVIYRSLPSKT
ncbi:hypothetical protein SAMN05444487_103180 [Marininema mesophilum]|uniref:PDZ domain-containing protein n=1 Tax=Marininema mesophilum TaxID=1048340 RepID=A0A1H2TM72_9BACL|nr:PDZ domain-containing protein [Marininema mesophilum]SDW44952.1 hypothetical protein SAMN05444487_103180 [Marininema mesophilum]